MPPSKLTQSQTTKKPTQAVLSSYFSSPTKGTPARQGQRRQREATPESYHGETVQSIDLTLSDGGSDAELWREVEGRPPAKRRKPYSRLTNSA